MKPNKLSKIMLCLILVVILSNAVFGLGVAPSRVIEDYEPGKTIKGTLTIINNQEKTFKAVIEVKGELAEYTTLSDTLLIIPATAKTHNIKYEIVLPEGIEKPGDHETQIVVREFPEDIEGQSSQIASKVAVISQIRVFVPYPGKYVESKLYISDARQGEEVIFTMPIFNFGSETIESVFGKVEIFNPEGEKVGETIATTLSNIEPQGESKIVGKWVADVTKGVYRAVATINYDGEEIRLEKDFTIDNLRVNILDIGVPKFRLGEIAEFEISLYNDWNQKLSNVFAEIEVKQDNKVYAELKTASVDIDPESSAVISAYWDTEGIFPGVYEFDIALHYAGRVTQNVFQIQVFPQGIEVVQQAPTGLVVEPEEIEGLSREAILVAAVILLAVINTALVIYIKRRKKGGV